MDKQDAFTKIVAGSKEFGLYDINALNEPGLSIDSLPFSIKILVENVLRNMGAAGVSEKDLGNIAGWQQSYDEPLEIHGLNCGVQINGNFFATGVSDEPVTLPASGTTVLQVTVYTSMIDIAGSIIALLQENVQHSGPPAKPVEYELTGELRLGEQGERTVPFQLQGDFPPEK